MELKIQSILPFYDILGFPSFHYEIYKEGSGSALKNLMRVVSGTGTDEGIYAWVAANYALGTLGGDPQKTTGIFELGGASAQVLFSFQFLA